MSHELKREELIELIRRIIEASESEEVLDRLIEDFVRGSTLPSAADLIFSKEFDGRSAEQIADIVLSHDPLRLAQDE